MGICAAKQPAQPARVGPRLLVAYKWRIPFLDLLDVEGLWVAETFLGVVGGEGADEAEDMETLLERGEHDLGALQTGGAGDGVGPQLVHTAAAPCLGVGLCMSAWSDRVHLHLHDVEAGHGIVSVLRFRMHGARLTEATRSPTRIPTSSDPADGSFLPSDSDPTGFIGECLQRSEGEIEGNDKMQYLDNQQRVRTTAGPFFLDFYHLYSSYPDVKMHTSAAAMLCLPVYPPSMYTAHSSGDSELTCIHPAAKQRTKYSIFR